MGEILEFKNRARETGNQLSGFSWLSYQKVGRGLIVVDFGDQARMIDGNYYPADGLPTDLLEEFDADELAIMLQGYDPRAEFVVAQFEPDGQNIVKVVVPQPQRGVLSPPDAYEMLKDDLDAASTMKRV